MHIFEGLKALVKKKTNTIYRFAVNKCSVEIKIFLTIKL